MSISSVVDRPSWLHDPNLVQLNRRDPLRSAQKLVAARYMSDTVRALHHYRGVFYQWNGSCYSEADRNTMQAAIWDYLGAALHMKATEAEPFQPRRSHVSDVLSALEAVCNLRADVEAPVWLDGENDLPAAGEFLAVKNGLLHLPSGDLYPSTPNYFCMNDTAVEFDPEALVPTEWRRFLGQIWPDDPQSIGALQDIFGLLLSPDTSQQKILLIVGPKRSGKGTIAGVLSDLRGRTSVCNPTLASLETNFGLSPLIGKSIAIIGDARLSGRADQSKIAERLLSISGEDGQTIDRKFLSPWDGRLGIRFIIMTNELPRLADASGALASRFIVLQMENSFFGKEDRGLRSRLLAELPGILNWALVGYARLRERGCLLQPESARDAIEELEALGSPIATFVTDRCLVSAGLQCSVSRLFSEWKVWCETNGRREPGTVASFGRDLKAAVPGLKTKNLRDGCGGRSRHYEGIDIATAGDWK